MEDLPVVVVVLLSLDVILMASVVTSVYLENVYPDAFLKKAELLAGGAKFYYQNGSKVDLWISNSGTLGSSVTDVYVATTSTNMQRLSVDPLYIAPDSYGTVTIDYQWVSEGTYVFKADSSNGQVVVWAVKAPKEPEDFVSTQTFLRLVNPISNDNWFDFTPKSKSTNDVFGVNVEVVNVTSLHIWQISLKWDPRLVTFVNASIPEEIMLRENFFLAAVDSSKPGKVIFGILKSPGTGPFNGSGVLVQLRFRSTGSYGETGLVIAGFGVYSFLLDGVGRDIVFEPVNGAYVYSAD